MAFDAQPALTIDLRDLTGWVPSGFKDETAHHYSTPDGVSLSLEAEGDEANPASALNAWPAILSDMHEFVGEEAMPQVISAELLGQDVLILTDRIEDGSNAPQYALMTILQTRSHQSVQLQVFVPATNEDGPAQCQALLSGLELAPDRLDHIGCRGTQLRYGALDLPRLSELTLSNGMRLYEVSTGITLSIHDTSWMAKDIVMTNEVYPKETLPPGTTTRKYPYTHQIGSARIEEMQLFELPESDQPPVAAQTVVLRSFDPPVFVGARRSLTSRDNPVTVLEDFVATLSAVDAALP